MPAVEARTPSLPADPPSDDAPEAQGRPPIGRAVMQHTLLAALGVLALALALGMLNARQASSDEAAAALATARLSRYLGNLPQMSDAQAVKVLGNNADLRHLRLRVTDGSGNVRIGAELPVSATEHSVAWTVARPEGPPWTVTLVAAPEADWVDEALATLRSLAGLGLALGAVLGALAWSLGRALAPAGGLVAAMRTLQHGDAAALRLLPRMPVAEFETLRGGLLKLAGTLRDQDRSHRQGTRRLLAQQEADRSRLERRLADSFDEPLGALRLDAVWLRRQLAANRQFEPVVSGMLSRLSQLSHALDRVLAHLNPLGERPDTAVDAEHPDRLLDLMLALIDDGPAGSGDNGSSGYRSDSSDSSDSARRSLVFESDAARLPRPLVLAVYRMSQEALLNVARHASAREATLRVVIDSRSRQLRWSVTDDGRGLSAVPPHSTGLAAMQAQALAFGGELTTGSGPGHRGLVLRTTLTLDP